MRLSRLLIGTTMLMTTAIVGITKEAQATFPGTNGEIAYSAEKLEAQRNNRSIRTIQPDGTSGTIVITENQSADNTHPYDADYSPDGSNMAIVLSGSPGSDRLLIVDTQSGERDLIFRVMKLSQGAVILSVAFSPTGNRLMFCAVFLSGPNRARLFTVNVDGSDVKLVSDRSSCLADWSSTNKIVAAAGSDLGRVVTMNPDGINVRSVGSTASFGFYLSWSPDGSRLVYTVPVGALEQYELFSVAPDGTGRIRLTDTPLQDDIYPVFSPDGGTIAFTRGNSDPASNYYPDVAGEIFTMSVDGSNVQRLTNTPNIAEVTRSWRAVA